MLVQFFTEPLIGPEDRRRIRSHVMKGKNAGKPRPPRKALIHCRADTTAVSVKKHMRTDEHANSEHEHCFNIDRLLWSDLHIASFPEHISPGTTKFVYHRLWIIAKALYPPEFCLEIDLSQYAWFTYVLEDKACKFPPAIPPYLAHADPEPKDFQTLLAISSSFPSQAHFGKGPRLISSAGLKHISTAYRLVNQRLSSKEACSDKAIAAVTILAIYQRMHHQHEVGLVHFTGLIRMIQLRGGLAKLFRENRCVAQKPWRLALEFSLQDGSPVSFGLDEIPSVDAYALMGGCTPTDVLFLASTMFLDPILRTHFENIASFTNLLVNQREKFDPYDYSDAVCLRLHRLLEHAPLDQYSRQHLTPLDDLVHLSLVAIMTTLMPEYGHNQARYNLLASQIRGAQRRHAESMAVHGELSLWALFVGYVTVLPDLDHAWLIPLVHDTCKGLGLRSWIDVRALFSRYAWIGVFYDKAGMKLWSTANVQ